MSNVETNYSVQQLGIPSFQLLPMLHPAADSPRAGDLVEAVESKEVLLKVQNQAKPLPVSIGLIFRDEERVQERTLRGMLVPNGPGLSRLVANEADKKLKLDLHEMELYGEGRVDLTISDPTIDGGKTWTFNNWATLKRPFVLEVAFSDPEQPNLPVEKTIRKVDLGWILDKTPNWTDLQVGRSLHMRIAQRPKELQGVPLSFEGSLDAQVQHVRDIDGSEWWIWIPGAPSRKLTLPHGNKSMSVNVAIYKKVPKSDKEKTLTAVQLVGFKICEAMPRPTLKTFSLSKATDSQKDKRLKGLAKTGVTQTFVDIWRQCFDAVVELEIANVSPHSRINFDLAFLACPDGFWGAFEMVRYQPLAETPQVRWIQGTPSILDEDGGKWIMPFSVLGGVAKTRLLGMFTSAKQDWVPAGAPFTVGLCQRMEVDPKKKNAPLLELDKSSKLFPDAGKVTVWRKAFVSSDFTAPAARLDQESFFCPNYLGVGDSKYDSHQYAPTLDGMVKIQMELKGGSRPKNSTRKTDFSTAEQVKEMLDPTPYYKDGRQQFQFILLDAPVNIGESGIRKHLDGSTETLKKELATWKKPELFPEDHLAPYFMEAMKVSGLNVAYLISHFRSEAGNSTKFISNSGGKLFFNAYGIGAFDNSADEDKLKRAIQEGWDTPKKAIVDGAAWVKRFMSKSGPLQNTLYKLRWNPEAPGTNLYGTDIHMANVLTETIYAILGGTDPGSFRFDFPYYSDQSKPQVP